MPDTNHPPTTLTLADVARYPRPGTTAPRRVEFTPDGAAVTYLFSGEGTLEQQLWRYDLASGERRSLTGDDADAATGDDFSIEEQLRRERSRTRERGVTDYQFVREGGDGPTVLLVPRGGALHARRGDGPLTKLIDTEGALDATLSPDGRQVAFVREDELWVTALMSDEGPRRLTSGAGGGVTNGGAEYIAQEEMGRGKGFWWSPDSRQLAYVRADSSHIPLYPIVHQGADTPIVEEHRYPFAGRPNARVRLGILPVAGADKTRWLDLGADDDIYLARVAWRPDGTLTAQIESRDQRTLQLVVFNASDGEGGGGDGDEGGGATTLIEERGDPWLNLADDLRFLPSGEFLWSHERSGFRHLALHGADGGEIRTLTAGEWVVTGVAALDAERRIAYFHGTRDGVTERHLYRVGLDGGPIERITEGPGWHEAVVSLAAGLYVDRHGSRAAAPTLTVRRLDGNDVVASLFADDGATATALGLPVPELTSFQTDEGVTLQAAIYAPPGAGEGGRRHPLIVSVYGGPHAQTVADNWPLTVDLRAQYLAQQGYVVLKVDNRGSANRGLRFEAAIAGAMGRPEVADQVAGVRWLSERAYVDGARVGIYGWSYGGYMTCMALLRAPDVFKVGVAGAPVTAWDGYDTHYTERYMGHPASNADGYRESAALTHVAALRGKLLLIHGLIDENVHFRHTARLIAALTAAGKEYDLVLFPGERHMPRDARGLEYQETRLADYFRAHL